MTTTPHMMHGTCFLEGILFDIPECEGSFDAQNDSESCFTGPANAGIEITSQRLQLDGQEILQARVMYSNLYSFSFSILEEGCREIVFYTTGGEERVKINLQGLTECFELKSMIIKDKNIITMMKNVTKRNQTLMRLRRQQISPAAFYATGTAKGVAVKVFEAFSRQEQAFRHYDATLAEHYCSGERQNPIKLFTFESLMTGKRQFLVADMESFMLRYLSLEGPKRHCYEIIREDFPCRLYFDLEYSISANPDANGPDLVTRWMHIVTWKLYEVYGLAVGPSNFIHLDSSNALKFSCHLIVILPDEKTDVELLPHSEPDNRSHCSSNHVLPPIHGQEFLFRNNIEVGRFIDIIISDVLMQNQKLHPQDNIGGSTSKEPHLSSPMTSSPAHRHCPSVTLQLPRAHSHKTLNPAQEAFFVWNSDRTAKTCFVDLGVYTRNRAFRLLSSCKFGKTSRLRVAPAVATAGPASPSPAPQRPAVGRILTDSVRVSNNYHKVNYFVRRTNNSSENSVSHNELFTGVLQRTFVVPSGVLRNSKHHDMDRKDSSRFDLLPSIESIYLKLPCFLQCPSLAVSVALQRSGGYSGDNSGISAPSVRRTSRIDDENCNLQKTVSIETLASSQHSFPIEASPFPSVDAFVTSLAARGGPVGRISQWLLKRTTTTTTPITTPITSFNEGRGDNEDNIVSSPSKRIKTNESNTQPCHSKSFSTVSLEYQILGNRFCQNINRAHKSNNIMFEVHLNSGYVRQKCWDVDCRGFRSDPLYLPIQSSPSLLEIDEAVGDILIQHALLRDSACL